MAPGAPEVTLESTSSGFAALIVGQSQLDGESSPLLSLEGKREREEGGAAERWEGGAAERGERGGRYTVE